MAPVSAGTIRSADIIVVMDAGRVAEVGHHDELLTRRGAYAQLVQAQMEHKLPMAATG